MFFPQGTLDEDVFIIKGGTNHYSCYAWSVNINSEWVEPAEGAAWPAELPLEYTVENFQSFYELFGFQTCANAEFENGYEKVALYCMGGVPTHAARSLKEGVWTSKLGRGPEIIHKTLKNIEGPPYGEAQYFLKGR